MAIDCFRTADCPAFLAMAAGEGWVCDQWELDFLLGSFPKGCLVWREEGLPTAFITAANYGRSGWIGNLIVTPALRGRGIGSQLLHQSLAALEMAEVETVWLTASAAGQPLYEKLGFQTVDTVCRWRGSGAVDLSPPAAPEQTIVRSIDRAGWGDSREPALAMLAGRGALLVEEDGFLLCNSCGGGVQLGPWGSSSAATATRLLTRALSAAGKKVPLFLDVPQQNLAAAVLLDAHGFVVRGSTQLMYRGRKPAYTPAMIYGLASMGSFG